MGGNARAPASGQDAEAVELELEEFIRLEQPYVGFLAFSDEGRPMGMIDARVRNYAEGAPNLRAAYVEDLWVEPDCRGQGIAMRLLEAVEQWAREQGLDWLGSDTELANERSRRWHEHAGFDEIERIVVFGKTLD